MSDSLHIAQRPETSGADPALSVFRVDGTSGHASSWKIDDEVYATNVHALSHDRQTFLIGHDGARYPIGGDVWLNRARDIAFFKLAPGVEGPKAKSLETAAPVEPGKPVTTIGFGGELFFPNNEPTKYDSRFIGKEPPFVLGSFKDTLRYSTNAEAGVSGGADVDADHKVVSMPFAGSRTQMHSIPIDAVLDSYRSRETLEHRSGHYENGLQTFLNDKDNTFARSVEAGSWTLGATAGAASLSAMARNGLTLRNGLGMATPLMLVGTRSYFDAQNLKNSTNTRDTVKYALAAAADTAMAVGLGLTVGRFGTVARLVAASGVLGRIGAEFVPNNYVVDYKQPGE